MCEFCRNDLAVISRRRLGLLAFSSAALLVGGDADAKEKTKSPPKPDNVISPDAALDRLREGNGRYVGGKMRRHDFKGERESLVGGQNPYAAVLS
ncbi:MAG: carbonic anhydrase, partial [Bradyrhizobium sp.]